MKSGYTDVKLTEISATHTTPPPTPLTFTFSLRESSVKILPLTAAKRIVGGGEDSTRRGKETNAFTPAGGRIPVDEGFGDPEAGTRREKTAGPACRALTGRAVSQTLDEGPRAGWEPGSEIFHGPETGATTSEDSRASNPRENPEGPGRLVPEQEALPPTSDLVRFLSPPARGRPATRGPRTRSGRSGSRRRSNSYSGRAKKPSQS